MQGKDRQDDKPDVGVPGVSEEPETAIQSVNATEHKTLLQTEPRTGGEPNPAATAAGNPAGTKDETEFETGLTAILPTESQSNADRQPTKASDETSNENALRPNRLRFALVCLLFVFVAGWDAINLIQQLSVVSSAPEWTVDWEDNRFVVISVTPDFADQIKVDDELLSINNEPIDHRNLYLVFEKTKPGERYTLQLRRGGVAQLLDVALIANPRLATVTDVLGFYLPIFLSGVFFVVGLAVFLLKPNNKQVLLVAIFFATESMSAIPKTLSYIIELPLFFAFWWRAGFLLLIISVAILLHLALLFPDRSRILRRFPNLEWLIYVPVLLFLVPGVVRKHLSREGFTQFENSAFSDVIDGIGFFIILFCFCGTFAVLLLNYLKADKAGKRRVRLVVIGFAFQLVPLLLVGFTALIGKLFNISVADGIGPWLSTSFQSLYFLMPLTVAYAILRHRVLPISFVVRRGLQYLLAKNALRLLLVLPIVGIMWNIAANPDRTLNQILLNNSFGFYSCIALAVVFAVLIRSRFSEWIDRRFFREQYNQEQVLRQLTEAVKESDSLPKLSRLVSSKIQSALHPTSVHLFFQENRASDFTLGYATSATSTNLKLAAESPLLRFFNGEHGAIEFPTRQTDHLPNREKQWLRETGANLLVPMHGSDRKLAGFFSLGEKMSQIPYTQRDKELLETLANQIALVHENLGLKEQVRREQRIKTEVLSRFDEGDINLLKECPRCGKCFDRVAKECDTDGAELTFSLPVERTIENRYRLEQLLGRGGMGAVYEATDTRIDRRVATKILSGAMFGNKDALRRFEREAQTAGKLNHRNIVTVFDYGVLSTEGAFLVMELVRGETLSEVLNQKKTLDAETVVSWFGQVLDGVKAAHKAGIVHRDLKPDNIFVTRNEDNTVRLCILDFGLARFNEHEFADNVTVPGTVMGTLGYMSPEQLSGERIDERSDLFAVGVMIFECLNGEKPFAGKTYQEIVRSMSNEIAFDKSNLFARFFERGLALKPENRFSSAGEMKSSLLSATF
ncbi:MAG TPA: protein kinase [Pyrinomonadaceae bacterium]|nr:protein kinase [Pyrinomonadaceae bacterium]